MVKLEKLENEINKIKERNARVEGDKAWETSLTRRIIVAIGTYALSLLLFVVINAPNPFLAALVPTFGFILSTLTIPFFRSWWLKKQKRK